MAANLMPAAWNTVSKHLHSAQCMQGELEDHPKRRSEVLTVVDLAYRPISQNSRPTRLAAGQAHRPNFHCT